MEEKLKSSPEAIKLRAELRNLEEKRKDIYFQAVLVQTKLTNQYSPVQRELDKDPELIKLKEAASKAEDRRTAMKTYRARREEKLKKLPEAQPLLAELDSIRADQRKIDGQIREVQRKLYRLRNKLRTAQDPEIAAAREKAEEARKAADSAWRTDELKKLREQWTAASRAMHAKLTELMEQNEEASKLQAELKAINKRLRELSAAIRKAEGKK